MIKMIFVVITCVLLFADYAFGKSVQDQNVESKIDERISSTIQHFSIASTTIGNETNILESRKTMMITHDLSDEEALDYEEIEIEPNVRQAFAKQIGVPSNPVGLLVSRLPCTCKSGVCACCTGILLSAFRTKGCVNITYVPEDFAFEVKMMMNDNVLYETTMSGKNPRPICLTPPRIGLIKMCAKFHDIYFIGRNMHVCLNMEASFQGYELFDRSFNCMRIGDQGVKIVRPEDGGDLPSKPSNGNDAIVDSGNDDIEDYDENLIRTIL